MPAKPMLTLRTLGAPRLQRQGIIRNDTQLENNPKKQKAQLTFQSNSRDRFIAVTGTRLREHEHEREHGVVKLLIYCQDT